MNEGQTEGKPANFGGNPPIYASFPYFPNYESDTKSQDKYTRNNSKKQPKHFPDLCISKFSWRYFPASEPRLGLFSCLTPLTPEDTRSIIRRCIMLHPSIRGVYFGKIHLLLTKWRKSTETCRFKASQLRTDSRWRIRLLKLQS